MKTTAIILTFILSTISVNSFAKSTKHDDIIPEKKVVFFNQSKAMEYILNDEKEKTYIKKIYINDIEGRRKAVVVYMLDKSNAKWIVSQRTNYKYDKNNRLIQIQKACWNRATTEWTKYEVQNVLLN